MRTQAGRRAGGMHTGWQQGRPCSCKACWGCSVWSDRQHACKGTHGGLDQGSPRSATIVPDHVHGCHSEGELYPGSSHQVCGWLSMQQGSCQQLTLGLPSNWRRKRRALTLEVLLASCRYSSASVTRLSPCRHRAGGPPGESYAKPVRSRHCVLRGQHTHAVSRRWFQAGGFAAASPLPHVLWQYSCDGMRRAQAVEMQLIRSSADHLCEHLLVLCLEQLLPVGINL